MLRKVYLQSLYVAKSYNTIIIASKHQYQLVEFLAKLHNINVLQILQSEIISAVSLTIYYILIAELVLCTCIACLANSALYAM